MIYEPQPKLSSTERALLELLARLVTGDTPLITRSWQMAVLGESRSGVLQLWIEGDVPDIKQELHGCGGTEFNAPHWPGFFFASTATFTDGRYDTGGTFPLAPNETGEHFWELHMRQPRR